MLPVTDGAVKRVYNLLAITANINERRRKQAAAFLASFVSGTVGFWLLNSGYPEAPAGKTLYLTLFTVSRALDVLIYSLWSQRKARRVQSGQWSRIESGLGQIWDSLVFCASAGAVMFAWFYFPERLPRQALLSSP